MLEHGVTFMNYVGQPLHYIIDALEKKYGSGEAWKRPWPGTRPTGSGSPTATAPRWSTAKN